MGHMRHVPITGETPQNYAKRVSAPSIWPQSLMRRGRTQVHENQLFGVDITIGIAIGSSIPIPTPIPMLVERVLASLFGIEGTTSRLIERKSEVAHEWSKWLILKRFA